MHPSLHSVLHGFPLCERHFHLSRKSNLKFNFTVAWKKQRNKLFVGTILIKNGTISMKVGTIAVR